MVSQCSSTRVSRNPGVRQWHPRVLLASRKRKLHPKFPGTSSPEYTSYVINVLHDIMISTFVSKCIRNHGLAGLGYRYMNQLQLVAKRSTSNKRLKNTVVSSGWLWCECNLYCVWMSKQLLKLMTRLAALLCAGNCRRSTSSCYASMSASQKQTSVCQWTRKSWCGGYHKEIPHQTHCVDPLAAPQPMTQHLKLYLPHHQVLLNLLLPWFCDRRRAVHLCRQKINRWICAVRGPTTCWIRILMRTLILCLIAKWNSVPSLCLLFLANLP